MARVGKSKQSHKKRTLLALRMLNNVRDEDKRSAIRLLSNDGVDRICEAVRNILFCRQPMCSRKKNQLRKLLQSHSKAFHAIADINIDTEKRKRLLEQKGGFLGTLLSIAIPIISGIIAATSHKKHG